MAPRQSSVLASVAKQRSYAVLITDERIEQEEKLSDDEYADQRSDKKLNRSSSTATKICRSLDRGSESRSLRRCFSEVCFINQGPEFVLPSCLNVSVDNLSGSSCAQDQEQNEKHSIVVVPSLDLDRTELRRMGSDVFKYEERQLYHLLFLRHPNVRVVFLSSEEVPLSVIRYYLTLRGDGGLYEKLARICMLSPHDTSRPLSEAVLGRPAMLSLIRDLLSRGCWYNRPTWSATCAHRRLTHRAGLSVYCGSWQAQALSSALDIRALEASPSHQYWGTKQGGRELLSSCLISIPPGTPDARLGDYDDLLTTGSSRNASWERAQPLIRRISDLSLGLARQICLAGVRPKRWVVKLNMGFSGKGNALLALGEVQDRTYARIVGKEGRVRRMARDIEQVFPEKIRFQDHTMSWEDFTVQMERLGAIAEAFVEGEQPSSPSVQGLVEAPAAPCGEPLVKILSTHEQILDGQTFVGCKNPARSEYRQELVDNGFLIGQHLAARGVVGHFSVDFLAASPPTKTKVQNDLASKNEGWQLYALEINLRQGGTTHPYTILSLLVDGTSGDDGVYRNRCGQPRCYVATDQFQRSYLRGVTEEHLLSVLERAKSSEGRYLHWDENSNVGVVVHLFSFLRSHGRLGYTAIGNSNEQAQDFFDSFRAFLDDLY